MLYEVLLQRPAGKCSKGIYKAANAAPFQREAPSYLERHRSAGNSCLQRLQVYCFNRFARRTSRTFVSVNNGPRQGVMSEAIKHECGIALIRLRKPLDHYQQRYGTSLYGLNKLYLLMEKQ